MTDVETDDIVTISRHEAGHAVVARQLGIEVVTVSLNNVSTLFHAINPTAVWAQSFVALARPAAEQRLRNYTFNQRNELWLTSWATDRANAVRHLQQCDLEPGSKLNLQQIENMAAHLVEQHWGLITRVADALVAAGQLSGTAARVRRRRLLMCGDDHAEDEQGVTTQITMNLGRIPWRLAVPTHHDCCCDGGLAFG